MPKSLIGTLGSRPWVTAWLMRAERFSSSSSIRRCFFAMRSSISSEFRIEERNDARLSASVEERIRSDGWRCAAQSDARHLLIQTSIEFTKSMKSARCRLIEQETPAILLAYGRSTSISDVQMPALCDINFREVAMNEI